MVDGFKQYVPINCFPEDFIDENFHLNVSNQGEVIDIPIEVEIRGLKLKLFPGQGILIRGSLHRFANNGNHNHNNFSFGECVEAIDKLADIIGAEVTNHRLQNLEIGLNVKTNLVNQILAGLLLYKTQPFNRSQSSCKNYSECITSEKIIKVYNKGLQFNLNQEILRFELRFIKSRQISKLGIVCLEDLKKKDTQILIKNAIMDEASQMLIVNPTLDIKQLPPKKRSNYLEFINPHRWNREDLTRHQKRQKKISLRNTSQNYSNIDIQKVLLDLLKESIDIDS